MTEPIKLTLDQRRAEYAWKRVNANLAHGKTYVNFTKSAPAFIMSNGLMQALAFYESRKKNDKAAHEIVMDIVNWLGLSDATTAQHLDFRVNDGEPLRNAFRSLYASNTRSTSHASLVTTVCRCVEER